MVNRELALHFALRSDDNVEVGIDGDIVVRRAGWLARMLRESCPHWLQEVLLVAERRLPMAFATAHYTGGVLRIYRLGQPWARAGGRQRPLRCDRLRGRGPAVPAVDAGS